MADYNIYIHSAISSSDGEATRPWSSNSQANTQFQPWQTSQQSESSDRGTLITSPQQFSHKAISELASAIPWVAVAIAIIRVGQKVFETALDFHDIETGDVATSFHWNNQKSFMSSIFNPIAGLNALKINTRLSVENDRKRMNRILLGDSVINSYTNRGV